MARYAHDQMFFGFGFIKERISYLVCFAMDKWGQHGNWILVLVNFILGRHLLSGADPEYYFDFHVVPPEYQPKGDVDCRNLARYNQA